MHDIIAKNHGKKPRAFMTSAEVFNAKLDKTSLRDFTFFMLTKKA